MLDLQLARDLCACRHHFMRKQLNRRQITHATIVFNHALDASDQLGVGAVGRNDGGLALLAHDETARSEFFESTTRGDSGDFERRNQLTFTRKGIIRTKRFVENSVSQKSEYLMVNRGRQ